MKLKTISFLLIYILLSGCGTYYRSMTATVVDSETMKPIEGAIIAGKWFSSGGTLASGKTYKAVEVVTDKDGKAYIKSYFNPLASEFSLAVYKCGYLVWSKGGICKPGNVNRLDLSTSDLTRDMFPSCKTRKDFRWGDYTFKLEPFKPEYSHRDHQSLLDSAIGPGPTSYYDPIMEAFRECEGKEVRAEQDRINEIQRREEAEKRKK